MMEGVNNCLLENQGVKNTKGYYIIIIIYYYNRGKCWMEMQQINITAFKEFLEYLLYHTHHKAPLRNQNTNFLECLVDFLYIFYDLKICKLRKWRTNWKYKVGIVGSTL